MARRMLRVTYTKTVKRTRTYDEDSPLQRDREMKALRETIANQLRVGNITLEQLHTLQFEDSPYPPAPAVRMSEVSDDDPDEDADDDNR